MSTENRERILVRLESGQDTPIRGFLRDSDGCMCFQGVVADEFIRATGRGQWEQFGESEDLWSVRFVLGSDIKVGWLPYEVEEWSGLNDNEIMNATNLNDGGVSFPEIAAKLRAGELA